MRADFAVLKSNENFGATLTTSVSGAITMSYGDFASEQSNTPSHVYTDFPPYLLNIKDIDNSTIETISISGNTLTACDVSRYKNLTNLNVANNLLPRTEISKMLVDLDNNGQEDGTLTASGNISGSIASDYVTSFYSLVGKGWGITDDLLWTPQDITTFAWYNAADTSTINENGGAVSAIDDIGDGVSFTLGQATGSEQPTTGTRTINGLNVLDHDGGDYLDNALADLPASGNVAFFMVAEIDDINNANDSVFSTDGANDFQFDAERSSRFDGRIRATGIGGNKSLSDGPFAGPSIYNTNFDFTGAAIYNAFIDGIQRASDTAYTAKLSNSFINLIAFANRGAAESPNGAWGEFLLVEDVTQATREKIEGYLAWKWGLVASLPVAHPYKTIAP